MHTGIIEFLKFIFIKVEGTVWEYKFFSSSITNLLSFVLMITIIIIIIMIGIDIVYLWLYYTCFQNDDDSILCAKCKWREIVIIITFRNKIIIMNK